MIKLSEHDINNRDAAILYIDNKFYEDVTHAAAFQQYLKDINYKNLKSVKMRPDFSDFEEFSKNNNIDIILAHLVKKEDAVYIIYGFEDGIPVEFNSISQDIKNKFENEYELPVEDEMVHENSDYNPYSNDLSDIENKTNNRIKELETEQRSEFYSRLENLGYYYKDDQDYYTNESINLRIDDDGYTSVTINYIGGEEYLTSIEDLFEDLQSELELEDIEYLTSLGAKFKSLNALTFEITINNVILNCKSDGSGYNYKLISDTNLDIDKNNFDIYKNLEQILQG